MAASIFRIDVTIEDRDGNQAQLSVGSLRGLSYEQAEARASALVSALAGVTDASIRSYSLSKQYTVTPAMAAGPNSSIARKGAFVISLENDNYGLFAIPSLDQSTMIVDADGHYSWVIDWNSPAWAALNLALQGLVTQQGVPIVGLVIGGEAH